MQNEMYSISEEIVGSVHVLFMEKKPGNWPEDHYLNPSYSIFLQQADPAGFVLNYAIKMFPKLRISNKDELIPYILYEINTRADAARWTIK